MGTSDWIQNECTNVTLVRLTTGWHCRTIKNIRKAKSLTLKGGGGAGVFFCLVVNFLFE